MLNLLVAAVLVAQAAPSPAASPSPLSQPWTPAAIWRVQSFLDAALRAPTLAGAHVGLLAVDQSSGTVLYARDADDAFVPASTFKLVTGSAALARLGPAFTFVTDVDAFGSAEGGTLQGDLYLRGGGDSQLSSQDLDAAAAAVEAAGIRRISGALVGDASRYDAPHFAPGWAIDDIPYEFAAVPSALSFDRNVAHVRVLPGEAIGAQVVLQSDPASDTFRIENDAVTGVRGSEDTTDLQRPWDQPSTIRVVGSYPLGAPASDDLEPAVPDPPAYALDQFSQALARHGIEIGDGLRQGIAPGGATVVWARHSKPLSQLMGDFWLPSNNLLGEQLLEELGVMSALGARYDSRASGIAAEAQWLQSIGVDAGTLTIVDGSGLSAYDRVSPRALVAILNADWRSPLRDIVLASLPIAGVRGTLRSTFAGTPLQGILYAKTGTANHARLLAGYLQTPNHGAVTFALMVNDWTDASPGAGASLDAARAAVLTALLQG